MVWKLAQLSSAPTRWARCWIRWLLRIFRFFPTELCWLAALVAYYWKTCGASSLQHALTFVALAFWFIFIAGWIVKNGTLQEWLSG
ncbi:hypothetical protein DSC_01760 [Pseudoxanthomonas spadix BD-a59]|uniref:Uncharacterized protein n=1 Tax=Pseudoxanthomonas spadix (strain BD-a59) TaxID=1045855 RepID=G7UUB6_PSEUP|nr:hypothetical protein [Pseudoxanthomonas spadix]AER55005.1 hypothetical protein DSC_01760 [Pseudoxanthomonas spadix BD-a59]